MHSPQTPCSSFEKSIQEEAEVEGTVKLKPKSKVGIKSQDWQLTSEFRQKKMSEITWEEEPFIPPPCDYMF